MVMVVQLASQELPVAEAEVAVVLAHQAIHIKVAVEVLAY